MTDPYRAPVPSRVMRGLLFACAGIAVVLGAMIIGAGISHRPHDDDTPSDYGFTEDDSPTPDDFELTYISRRGPGTPTYTITVDARGNTTGTTGSMAASDVARLWHLVSGYHFFEWRTPIENEPARGADHFASRLEVHGKGKRNFVRCIRACPRGWNEIVDFALEKMPP